MPKNIDLFHQGELSASRVLKLLRRLEDSETLIRRITSPIMGRDKYALEALQDDGRNYLIAIKDQDDE